MVYSTIKKVFSLIIAFLIIAILSTLVYKLFYWLIVYIPNIDPNFGTAIIAGMTTIITSVSIATYNARKSKEISAYEAHRERKLEEYMKFMDLSVQLMKNIKDNTNSVQDKELEDFFFQFTSKIIIYGGPGVIKAYQDFRTGASDGNNILPYVDKLFREMRKDLGESNKNLIENDLISLFIIGGKNELDKIVNSKEKNNDNSL